MICIKEKLGRVSRGMAKPCLIPFSPPSLPPSQELLPKEPTNVIELKHFLVSGQNNNLISHTAEKESTLPAPL